MSDRITIDHMRNNVIIQVHSITLSNIDNHAILQWIKTFLQNLEDTHLQYEFPGDITNEITPSDPSN
jgi:hypothetical protein